MAAQKRPDRIAIEGPDRSLTYAELSSAAISAAGALQQLGVRGGSRVALALPPGEDFVIALHGCLLAGAAAVPIDLRLGDDERSQRLAGANVIVSEPLRGPPPTLPSLEGGNPTLAVMHTSGTTAAPRPVALTRANWLASALGSAVALGLDAAERWLCPMPLTHVGGLSIPVRSAIYATTAVLHGRFDTETVLAELMDPSRRTTVVSLVPTMLARILELPPATSRSTNSKMTAPTKATTILPRNPAGMPRPNFGSSKPPMNAPMMPTTMSPTRPKPPPFMTRPASQPAIKPTTSQTRML